MQKRTLNGIVTENVLEPSWKTF